MPWRGPNYPGEVPTLGWYVLDWMAEWLVVPDDKFAGEPLVLTSEQAQFILDFYSLDPRTGRRRVRRGIYSRPKGHGKSPLVGGVSIVEALGDVVPDGWDAQGEPVGRTWASLGYKPKVQLLAVSEDQVQNSWDAVLDMIRLGPLVDEPGIEAMETFVTVPRGRIEPVTSSASSREGFRPVFAALDQTESWTPSNGGRKLAAAVRRNLSKTGGASIETPNAYVPGLHSVAEESFTAAGLQGRHAKVSGILLDHREAPPETNMADEKSLREGLRVAYGCSADAPCALAERGDHPKHVRGWVDLDRKVQEIYDPDTDPQDAAAYYLNQVTQATDAWLSQSEVSGALAVKKAIADGDLITLGFDGSRGRAKGKPDATALIGCRVSDGHLFELGVWETGEVPAEWDSWEPPLPEIEAAIRSAFSRFAVAGFYADPAKDWRSHVNAWEAEYGGKVKVKARRDHPFEWWMTGGRSSLVQSAVEQLEGAIRNKDASLSGEFRLTQHLLNARRRLSHGKLALGKENDYSPNKIDAAVAAVLAWQARLDALAAGVVKTREKKTYSARRLR